jgi:hypothetical protein
MKIRIQSLATVSLMIVCFAVCRSAHAVVPPPDGGYPGGNTAEGQDALLSLTTGIFNTAVGLSSLRSNTLGQLNTAVGAGTLFFNVGDPAGFAGIQNTAVGAGALFSNFLGSDNTATGALALLSNDNGFNNTAVGSLALLHNTDGEGNTAVGTYAMRHNTTGFANTAVGEGALDFNTEGVFNIAIGGGALSASTVARENAAVGYAALLFNTEGDDNTAIGHEALYSNTTGSYNTAIGQRALTLNTTGSGNIVIGSFAGINITTADGVVCIGNELDGENVSNTTWLGNVYGVTTQSGTTAPVVVSEDGQFGTVASSERFKKDIASMDRASEAILSLWPVTFHYKSDTKGTPQFGLIAEEVAKVNPALVLPDRHGKPYTVRYDAVNAMLLNEFLKEHRRVEELTSAMAQQRKEFEAVVARLNEQEARIQKVSAQVETSSPVRQILAENP